MADTYTLFSDIPNFNVQRLQALLLDPTFYNDDLLNLGVIRRSAFLDTLSQTGVQSGDIAYFNPLADLEPDVASKLTSDRADINGTSGATMKVVNNFRSKTFGSSRVISTITGNDMMGEIARHLGRYSTEQFKNYLASIMSGVSKAAGADHTLTDTKVLGLKGILKALQLKGDAKTRFKTIVMNSVQHYYLQDAEVGFRPASETNTGFDQIAKLNIVVSDEMEAGKVAILADGAFQYGKANLGKQALGYTSDELLANGWGADALTAREQFILAPAGVNFVGAITGNGASPTNADVVNGNDWQIAVTDKKALPFIFMNVATTPA